MDNLEKIFDKAKEGVKLSQQEKEKMKGFILSVTKTPEAPVRDEVFERRTFKRLLTYAVFSFSRPAAAFAVLMLVIASGAGISLAAEGSLPGDILYPIKIEVNEGFREHLARSDEAKMEWFVSVAERRMEETERLASEDRLDDKARATIEANFSENAAKIKTRLSATATGGEVKLSINADVTSRLETSLMAHEEILSKLAEKNSGSKKEITSVLVEVKSISKSVKEVRKNFEDDVFEKRNSRLEEATALRLKASLEAIAEAKKALEKSGDSIDEEVRKKAEEMIKEAEEIVAEVKLGKAAEQEDQSIMSLKSSASSTTEALTRLHEAVKLSSQAKLMLEAQSRLKLKVLEFPATSSRVEIEEKIEERNEEELEINL